MAASVIHWHGSQCDTLAWLTCENPSFSMFDGNLPSNVFDGNL
jgi:hypothetical protein